MADKEREQSSARKGNAMNRDDVIRMAREAGIGVIGHGLAGGVEELERLSHLIASHVAEECAKHYEAMKYQEFFGDQIAEEIRSLYKPTVG